MLVLAIESSTSSAKAVLYDTQKGIVRARQSAYGDKIDQGGRTDAEAVYELSMRMGREAAQGADVAAIALCGTWHGLCVCDETMRPVTPVYSWNFTGTAGMCRELREDPAVRDRLYHNTGCMPHNTYPRHVLPYLREQGMDLTGKRFLTQGGYNFYRLTGAFWESVSTQSGSGFINLRTRDYDEDTLALMGIERGQLGELVSYRETLPLNEDGARTLGLKSGIPVVPAHPDGALNQIGNYAFAPGNMTLSVGTSGALRMAVEEPTLPAGRELWCYCGAEGWILGAAIAGACSCVNWFTQRYLQGKFSYGELEALPKLREDIPVFLPFIYGERCPGWHDERRGGFLQIDPEATVQEMYFSLQMGVLFNLYQCCQVLTGLNGTPAHIYVSGGITNSERWLRMLATIFQKEIAVADYPNASAMGAVALAMYTCGALPSLGDFREGKGETRIVAPEEALIDYYDRQYERYRFFHSHFTF